MWFSYFQHFLSQICVWKIVHKERMISLDLSHRKKNGLTMIYFGFFAIVLSKNMKIYLLQLSIIRVTVTARDLLKCKLFQAVVLWTYNLAWNCWWSIRNRNVSSSIWCVIIPCSKCLLKGDSSIRHCKKLLHEVNASD